MKSSTFLVVATVAATLLLSPVVYAAPVNLNAPLNGMLAKEKTIKLSLHNDSSISVELRVGADLMTLAAGKSVNLKLPIGTRIVANSDTSTIRAGTLIAEVSKELSGVIVHIK